MFIHASPDSPKVRNRAECEILMTKIMQVFANFTKDYPESKEIMSSVHTSIGTEYRI